MSIFSVPSSSWEMHCAGNHLISHYQFLTQSEIVHLLITFTLKELQMVIKLYLNYRTSMCMVAFEYLGMLPI